MKPVVEITEAIGAQKWITISTVSRLLFKLLNKHFDIVECDSSLPKSNHVFQSFTKVLWITTPAFKQSNVSCSLPERFIFLSIDDKKATLESIKDEAALITIPQSVSLNSLEQPPTKRPQEDHKLLKLLDSGV